MDLIQKKIPVILDTDIGTDIDDTWALAMLLGSPELDLKMIVTEHGDTHYRARLAAKLLEVARRNDVPIGIGISRECDLPYPQRPWVEGYQLDDYSGVIYENGVQAMIDFVMTSPEPVTIIAIGVVTNLAIAIEIEPRIVENARFVGMHGSIYVGYGGSSEVSAEANVVNDIEAFRKVIAAPWLEIIITPLDTCGLVVLEGEHYQQIRQSENPILRAVMENYDVWSILNEHMALDSNIKSSTLFDTVAIYLAYADDLLEIEEVTISTTDAGINVVGPGGSKVKAALRWKDQDRFYDHLTQRLLAA
ncbi:MAG: nucleoside hydrolase [Anaerolineaceae bacterium]|nr:nucleoside hydrolase [Anaerolineaceae bacterium]